MATTKSSRTADPIAPPPSYELHTTYTPATEENTSPNGYSGLMAFHTAPRACQTSNIGDRALRRKLKYSLALNIFLLLIVLPLALIGFALVHTSNNSNKETGNNQPKDPGAAIFPLNDAFAIVDSREDVNPPRRCVTGFTVAELDEAFNNIQKDLDYTGRIWMAPCNEVAAIEYTNQGLKAEYDYVVV